MYDALETVIATEAGNRQLQSGVWQTLRNITGQTLSSRRCLGATCLKKSNCYLRDTRLVLGYLGLLLAAGIWGIYALAARLIGV